MAIEGIAAPVVPAAPAPEGKPETPAVASAAPAGTPETPKAPEPAAPSEAQRFAALTKKESALRKQQQSIKAAQDQLAKDKAELDTYRQEKELAKRNPAAIAKTLWGDSWYEHLTDFTLNGNKASPELIAVSVDEKLAGFKKQIEEERTAQLQAEKERLEAESERVIAEYDASAIEYVKQNSNLYELTVAYQAEYMVPELVKQTFQESGKVLQMKEAADQVEKYLEETARKTKKFSVQAPPQPQGDLKRIDSAQPRQTLSNNMTASSPPLNPARKTSEAERWKRALAKLERAE